MILKNFMEEKQLDFNQPLLSVRRVSSTASPSQAAVKKKTDDSLPSIPPLPVYKSDLKSGPIRNPGTVPFTWEQTPGRPKDEVRCQTRSSERPHIAPKLPPGRTSNIKHQSLDKLYEDRRNTRLSRAANLLSSYQTKCEKSMDGMGDAGSSCSEDVSEAYADAVDTLSRTESFFFNCSVTGVSGVDDVEMKPSGSFSTDEWTRDFMMGRFLPAAKAIASEAPQHTNRRQPITQAQPRNIQRIINMDKRPAPKQYIPSNSQLHAQDRTIVKSDDEDNYDGPGNSAATVCGLLPRFCLLNPVPGISLQSREAIELSRRAPAGGSKASSYCEVPNKADNYKVNESDPARKVSKNFRELLAEESSTCEMGLATPVEKTLYIDSVHKVKSLKSDSISSDAKRLCDVPGADFDAVNRNGLQRDAKSSSREDQDHDKKSYKLARSKFDGNGKIDIETTLPKKLSNQEQPPGRILKYVALTSSRMVDDIKTEQSQLELGVSGQEESLVNYQLPLSLPPPKSPSDSWLKRTLTTVPLKNSSPWSCIGTTNYGRIQASKPAPGDPKWETIVKTSNVQRRHIRFFEERLSPIPEA